MEVKWLNEGEIVKRAIELKSKHLHRQTFSVAASMNVKRGFIRNHFAMPPIIIQK